jgi:hypothetical protein
MTGKRLALLAIALWAITIVGLASQFIGGRTAPSDDGRTAVVLSPSERDFVLAEMRLLLQSVQGVVAGVAAGDMQKVEKAARAAGAAAPRQAPVELMMHLPLGFKKTGMGVHNAFDKLADAASAGASGDEVLSQLSNQLNTCVGCHAGYKLVSEQ